MRNLLNRGYDIEWFIIVLGDVRGAQRYCDLAAATGGAFLPVSRFDLASKQAGDFLEAFERSQEGGEGARYPLLPTSTNTNTYL